MSTDSKQCHTGALHQQAPLPFEAAQHYETTVLDWATADLPGDIAVVRNCAYGPDIQHRYDVFRRIHFNNAPILVFWHGGGWTNGYKEYVAFMADAVTRLGMVLVAPTYRLAPEHKLPAAFDDAIAALGRIRKHASSFGGAADRLYLAGHSAGGHLAALVALRRLAVEQAGIPPGTIQACLPISAIMDLHHPKPEKDSMEERVYTMVLGNAAEDALMSPLSWTAGNTVPMYLSYGEFDSERVIRGNQRIAALLAEQPADFRVEMEHGLDHFSTHTTLIHPDQAWYQQLAELISRSST
ncbi:alpha/beta hydrolase [Paraburkholderia domus]|uniref:alpha/beta hydrolase n=1 Tax=Paraburkholderia domus TaxID=2793075 RepID=UPI0019138A80|nr:alpha/beta hydrolase [Paraburkholderia domus]MBK5065992.1 alpha/beta fold hydrolase [Burkholderia sp. R-70199]